MFVAGICVGIVLVFFALSSIYVLSLFLGFGLGIFVQMFMTSNFTMVQMASPDEVRARIISMRFIAIGLGPIGMISLGIAAEVFGPQPSLVVMAVVNIVLVAVVFIAFPSVRRIESEVAAVRENITDV